MTEQRSSLSIELAPDVVKALQFLAGQKGVTITDTLGNVLKRSDQFAFVDTNPEADYIADTRAFDDADVPSGAVNDAALRRCVGEVIARSSDKYTDPVWSDFMSETDEIVDLVRAMTGFAPPINPASTEQLQVVMEALTSGSATEVGTRILEALAEHLNGGGS